MDIKATIERMGPLSDTDRDCISKGFSAGNYANAYETEDFETAQQDINGTNGFYRTAHLVGFYSTYEIYEIPEQWQDEVDHYRAVYAQLGVL